MSGSNKITSVFFNTGFLPKNSNELRIQQGLPNQGFSNLCAYNDNGKPSGLAGNPVQMYRNLATPLPKWSSTWLPKNA